ncbi:hypothetical protein Clacol_008113 [Clathrus columnatus]|uniref:Uncharacterized protein n=1 Tax=Clathrus columnatus TaxID=1419009 RepID=A0AAV5ALQ0_9AGAM|nr:hypothetical protein Clacol_008113 [Clathrus columnatus]
MSSPAAEPVSVLIGAPKNQSERIAWARKHRHVFEEIDEDVVGIVAKVVEEDDNDEDIAQFQHNYDKKVAKRRHELLVEREEAAMKKKEEDLAKMRELFPAIAEEMERLKSSQSVLVLVTQPAAPPSPIPIPSTSTSKPKPKPKPVPKQIATITTRSIVTRSTPAMAHIAGQSKETTAPTPKASGSHKRTIDLVKDDELEPEIKIMPPKKVKFVSPVPKEPVFGMGEVIEDGCVSCTNKNKNHMFIGSGDAGSVGKAGEKGAEEENVIKTVRATAQSR